MKHITVVLGIAAAIAVAPATAASPARKSHCPERAAEPCVPVLKKTPAKAAEQRVRSAILQATDRYGKTVWQAGGHVME